MKAMVEPLPLVPATWMTGGTCLCGSPSAESARLMRDGPSSIAALDWRARRSRRVPRSILFRCGHEAETLGFSNLFARLQARSRHHEKAQELGQGLAQLVAMDDHVEHAMLEQIF